jgi:hypothetical protein
MSFVLQSTSRLLDCRVPDRVIVYFLRCHCEWKPKSPRQRPRQAALSWLSASELRLLAGALALVNFSLPQIILREAVLASDDAHILLKGIVRSTC